MECPWGEPVSIFVLYQLLNKSGTVIYVGMTESHQESIITKFTTRPWYHEIHRVKRQEYNSREDLRAARKEAIAFYRPRHNQRQKPGNPS